MLTRLIASVSAWTFPRSCSQDRNESFSLGVGLGGFFVVAVLALTPMTTPAWANCFGDLTGPVGIPDGTVGIEDLQAVTSSWNHYQSAADLDGNISTPVGIPDLLLLFNAWGDCPNPCDQNPCAEDCAYDCWDVNGPCYDEVMCREIRCAEDPCYSTDCPEYCTYGCSYDPCEPQGPCYSFHECCMQNPCHSPTCDDYYGGCIPKDPCMIDPCLWGCPAYPCS